jgi:hypothetical protein
MEHKQRDYGGRIDQRSDNTCGIYDDELDRRPSAPVGPWCGCFEAVCRGHYFPYQLAGGDKLRISGQGTFALHVLEYYMVDLMAEQGL